MVKDSIRLIAEILEGIQVPGSMGLLGTAREPWIELMDRKLHLFGWKDANEIEKTLRQNLEEKNGKK